MKRRPDWRARLAAVHEAQRRSPHAYGRHDCALFFADCIEAMTGVDLAAGYRGRYRTAQGAMRILKAAGYEDICALVAENLDEIPPAFARAGDGAAFLGGTAGYALGIVLGERVTVLRPDGLGTVLLTTAARAFRV